jgi:transposase
MIAGSFSCDLPGCTVDQIEQNEQGLIVWSHVSGAEAICPTCKQRSTRVHSSYVRSPQDLPVAEQAVRIHLCVRRFRCGNRACPRQTFAEGPVALLPHHAQRTDRLTRTWQAVGFAVGGEAGMRLLGQMQMATSVRTLLRLLRIVPEPHGDAVRVLGVDDWAMRKGRTYGTILVDLERQRPIDLLPDRSAATLAAWLRHHPEVEIITRDRSTEYACGASEGAPQAQQVTDRWHLLQNLRQLLERLMSRLYPDLKQLTQREAVAPSASPEFSPQRTRLRLTLKDQEATLASRRRSLARYEQVHHLRQQGRNILQIAQQLQVSRTTVRKYFYAEAFPERAKQQLSGSMIDPYLDSLERRHQAGCNNAKQLWRELCEQGYPGAYVQVKRWLAQRRQRRASMPSEPARMTTDADSIEKITSKRSANLPSYTQLAWLLIQEPAALSSAELETLQHISQDARLAHTYQLAQQFRTMVRQHQASLLDSWLDACANSRLTEWVTFATGLRHDYAAVRAALQTHWSNAQTEGQVNRLKFLKRQMYGRANFDLLRLRVLHPN